MLLIIGGALLAAVTDCRRQMASDCLSRPAAWAPTTLPVDESVGRSKIPGRSGVEGGNDCGAKSRSIYMDGPRRRPRAAPRCTIGESEIEVL